MDTTSTEILCKLIQRKLNNHFGTKIIFSFRNMLTRCILIYIRYRILYHIHFNITLLHVPTPGITIESFSTFVCIFKLVSKRHHGNLETSSNNILLHKTVMADNNFTSWCTLESDKFGACVSRSCRSKTYYHVQNFLALIVLVVARTSFICVPRNSP